MRPGAAVRLKGTWKNDGQLEASSEASVKVEGEKAESSQAASSTTTAAELQVSEVEVLGPSDPQVRLLSFLSAFGVSFFTHMNFPDIPNSE